MSILGDASSLGSSALSTISSVLLKPTRGFKLADGSFFIPQVVIEEDHDDENEITRHPVERGADISDHSFARPARVTLRLGFTNYGLQPVSTIVTGLIQGNLPAIPADIRTTYKKILDIKNARKLFTLVTGKRSYPNMLIGRIRVTTNSRTENSLIISIGCEQVIIVDTQAVTVPPRGVQSDPASTAATTDGGAKQLTPAQNVSGGGVSGSLLSPAAPSSALAL